MSLNLGSAARYFMAAMLSVLIHAAIILVFIIVWSSTVSDHLNNKVNIQSSINQCVFWESKTDLKIVDRIMPIKPEMDSFSAQLTPISMVNSGNKITNPIQSMLKNLRDENKIGLKNRAKPISNSINSNILLVSLREDSSEERLGILIDRSLSMGLGGAWNQIVHEFDTFLPTISPETRARIWLFDKAPEEIAGSDDWGTWNKSRMDHALNQLHGTRPGGLTDLANALRTVSFRGSTRIVVISDDADLSINEWVSVGSSLRRLGKPLPRICAIRLGLSSLRDDNLAEICRQTGGWCRRPNQN